MVVCQIGKSSRSKESNRSRRRAGLEQHFETGKTACRPFFAGSALDEPEECGKIPENVKICIREEARKTVRQNYHLLYLEHRIIRTLQEAGVSVVLLKGASTAEFYPVPELRKSGDVDLFLPNPAQFPKAGERMENLGFVKNPAHSVNHHEVYVTEKHVEVELHTLLAEPFDDKETNRLMEELQKEVAVQAGKKKLMGIEFPVLPDGIRYVLPVQEHPLSSVGPVVHLHVQAIQQGDHLLRVCGISGRLQRL